MKTNFTIGEIFRMKLLKNHLGKAYTSKATISRIVAKLAYKEVKTAWGMSKTLSVGEIKKWNKHW